MDLDSATGILWLKYIFLNGPSVDPMCILSWQPAPLYFALYTSFICLLASRGHNSNIPPPYLFRLILFFYSFSICFPTQDTELYGTGSV